MVKKFLGQILEEPITLNEYYKMIRRSEITGITDYNILKTKTSKEIRDLRKAKLARERQTKIYFGSFKINLN